MPEHKKENKEAVVVDTRIGELIKALNLGKDEKAVVAHLHHLMALEESEEGTDENGLLLV